MFSRRKESESLGVELAEVRALDCQFRLLPFNKKESKGAMEECEPLALGNGSLAQEKCEWDKDESTETE